MTTEMAASAESAGFPWWAVLIQGIFSVLIGILLLTNPLATTLVIIQFLGIYWLVSGIFSLVGIFIDPTMWGLKLIGGILGILAGIIVMQHPLWSTVIVPSILIIILGVNGIILGVIAIIAAFRGGGWAAGILGALSILLGLLLLASPVVAALTLPWIYGVLAIVGGVLSIFLAFRQRKEEA